MSCLGEQVTLTTMPTTYRSMPDKPLAKGLPKYLQDPVVDWIYARLSPQKDGLRASTLEVSLMRKFELDCSVDELPDLIYELSSSEPELVLGIVDFILGHMADEAVQQRDARVRRISLVSGKRIVSVESALGPLVHDPAVAQLEELLEAGGSEWRVEEAESELSLERRIEQTTVERLGISRGSAGDWLRKAFSNAYGRNRNPSVGLWECS